MTSPYPTRRLLDLYSGAGGAGRGYERAGFRVFAVDIDPQPHNPYPFHQGDALSVLRQLLGGGAVAFEDPADPWDFGGELLTLADFDAIHSSPPCKPFNRANVLNGAEHPDLVDDTRLLLEATGLPWIIENIPGAPLVDPLLLCGSMFELRAPDLDGVPLQLRRHRLFESNVFLMAPGSCAHAPGVKIGSVYCSGGSNTLAFRDRKRGTAYLPAFSVMCDLMGIHWTDREHLAQAIPPVYSEYLGAQLHAWIGAGVAA